MPNYKRMAPQPGPEFSPVQAQHKSLGPPEENYRLKESFNLQSHSWQISLCFLITKGAGGELQTGAPLAVHLSRFQLLTRHDHSAILASCAQWRRICSIAGKYGRFCSQWRKNSSIERSALFLGRGATAASGKSVDGYPRTGARRAFALSPPEPPCGR